MEKLPLDGIVVLDNSWVIAGPHGNRLLSDLGATVIKVENHQKMDPIRYDWLRRGNTDIKKEGGWIYQENSRNKLGITLDLKTKTGREIYYRLVARADVVTCNYTPSGFKNLGLDWETLRQHNPKIIVVNASGLRETD